MKKKIFITGVTIIVTLIICTIGAMYNPPEFGHSVTIISKEGGVSRHPVLLGLNEDKYVVLVTGTVRPPFHGDVRVALEGDPGIEYKIFSRYPPELKLGIHHFHDFEDNRIENISPWEQFMLAVRLTPVTRITQETKYNLKFYDQATDSTVLTIPIIFKDLVNFSISKNVRRPYPETHSSHNHAVNTEKSENDQSDGLQPKSISMKLKTNRK